MYLIPLFSNERYLMEIKLPRKSSVVKVDSVTGAKVIGKGICKGIRYIKYKFDNGEIIKAYVKYDTDIIYTDSKIPSNIVNSLPNGSFIDPNTDVEYARFHFAIPLILNKSFILSIIIFSSSLIILILDHIFTVNIINSIGSSKSFKIISRFITNIQIG